VYVLVHALKCVQDTGLAFWPRGRDQRAVGRDAAIERALPHVHHAPATASAAASIKSGQITRYPIPKPKKPAPKPEKPEPAVPKV
jgi:hypothetical protein